MLDRFGPRIAVAAIAVTGAMIALAAPVAGAAASPSATPASPSASSSASSSPSSSAAGPPAIGGAQLSGHGVIVHYGPGASPRLPGVAASAFVIADAGTGQVLAAKDPHGWYRPASTLKVLTAISLIPRLNPDGTVVASKLATSTVPNVVGLIAGHSYQISDLFTALLTISANDAAIALAQATGSYSAGMAALNAEARHLQADDTVAMDPNGLDAPGQHTSAYDLALIARQALSMPAFLSYDQTVTAKFPLTAKKSVTLFNQNALLTSYPGGIGGKIGWTSAAGATYIGMARRNGVTLIVTLLHCPALTEINSAESLLNWGFKAEGRVTPVGTLVGPLVPPAAAASAARSGASGARSGASGASGAARSAAPAGPASSAQAALRARSHPAAGTPSGLVAAGFTGVVLVTAGLGFAYSRRQRPGSGASPQA